MKSQKTVLLLTLFLAFVPVAFGAAAHLQEDAPAAAVAALGSFAIQTPTGPVVVSLSDLLQQLQPQTTTPSPVESQLQKDLEILRTGGRVGLVAALRERQTAQAVLDEQERVQGTATRWGMLSVLDPTVPLRRAWGVVTGTADGVSNTTSLALRTAPPVVAAAAVSYVVDDTLGRLAILAVGAGLAARGVQDHRRIAQGDRVQEDQRLFDAWITQNGTALASLAQTTPRLDALHGQGAATQALVALGLAGSASIHQEVRGLHARLDAMGAPQLTGAAVSTQSALPAVSSPTRLALLPSSPVDGVDITHLLTGPARGARGPFSLEMSQHVPSGRLLEGPQ